MQQILALAPAKLASGHFLQIRPNPASAKISAGFTEFAGFDFQYYTVFEKLHPFYFCNNFFIHEPNFIIFVS